MKIAVLCNLDDSITAEMIKDGDQLQMMDLTWAAISAKKRIVMLQADNSGVIIEREYPARAEVPAPKGKGD